MKDTLLIGGLCVLILVVGAVLYFYEPERDYAETGTHASGETAYELLAEGQYALEMDQERNYRIRSQEELETIWAAIHGETQLSVPSVDFSTNEVLAVFDGSHETGGYGIRVIRIDEANNVRTVHIEHVIPDESCILPSVVTSPFQLVTVPKAGENVGLDHIDSTVTVPCS